MALARLRTIRNLYRSFEFRECSNFALLSGIGSSRNYSNALVDVSGINRKGVSSCILKGQNDLIWACGNIQTFPGTKVHVFLDGRRAVATKVNAPPQARLMGGMSVSISSPGIIYEPYAPREQIPFWRRWFTRSGWRRTKEDIMLEMKSAYAISKLRKCGYSRKVFYKEASKLYKEINTLIARGDKRSLRKAVTENMYSVLKNEIKQRESRWSSVYWEVVEPTIKIRTLRARLIGVDQNDHSKAFIQLTLEFLSKQKFEAYDSKGKVVAGNKNKEVLVLDIWVFEKSLFHTGAYWRVCGRIPAKNEAAAKKIHGSSKNLNNPPKI